MDRTAASGVSSGSAGAEGSEEHYQTLAQHPLYPNGSRKCANGAKTHNVNTNQQPSDASTAGLLFDDQVLDRYTKRHLVRIKECAMNAFDKMCFASRELKMPTI